MANLNTEEIKKLKKGELGGLIVAVFDGIACVALIVFFSIAIARSDEYLRLYTCSICIPLMSTCSIIIAICNNKYNKPLDRIIKNYVQEVLIENAALMHPERDNIAYYISNEGNEFFVKTNNFKEVIIFDFSAFGKLSLARKATITAAIINRLGATFCRLMERGGKYKTVSYCAIKDGNQSKTINIIENGTPDKKIYKNYLKQQ
ncbi:MAG: hypothetical protein K2O28_05335 [Clostridia bacterium]|nr:hypothetical protein [Clostridia bacterium]